MPGISKHNSQSQISTPPPGTRHMSGREYLLINVTLSAQAVVATEQMRVASQANSMADTIVDALFFAEQADYRELNLHQNERHIVSSESTQNLLRDGKTHFTITLTGTNAHRVLDYVEVLKNRGDELTLPVMDADVKEVVRHALQRYHRSFLSAQVSREAKTAQTSITADNKAKPLKPKKKRATPNPKAKPH